MLMNSQVLFRNLREDRSASLEQYRHSGGYEALSKVLREYSPKEVRRIVMDAGLRGRGGAGFPTGIKWSLVPDDGRFPRYVVANADEMEPGTFKDRVLMQADPHLVIEGILLAGYAISASRGVIFLRPSYESVAQVMERELEVARKEGWLGDNILGRGFSMDVFVHRSGGRYICGESSALIQALQGKRANPRKPPPHTTEKGLWGMPTVLNNAETLACVPHIIRNGPEWFRSLAETATGAGTKLYCLSGNVNHPGCYEQPIGTRLSEIIEKCGGGLPKGSQLKACLPGGASTRFLPKNFYDVQLDFDPMITIGHRLGTGAIIVFDQKTCLVAATLNLMQFFARESCGWCTPCREGLPYVRDLLWRIEHGEGKEEFIPMLRTMSTHLWNSYCALAPGAASPLESLLTYFEDEVREHIVQKKCPFS